MKRRGRQVTLETGKILIPATQTGETVLFGGLNHVNQSNQTVCSKEVKRTISGSDSVEHVQVKDELVVQCWCQIGHCGGDFHPSKCRCSCHSETLLNDADRCCRFPCV